MENRSPQFILIWVIGVLALDLLATYSSSDSVFRELRWRPGGSFDLFKFLFWFVLPFALFRKQLNFATLSLKGTDRKEWLLFATLAASVFVVPWIIPYFESLSKVYRPMSLDRSLGFVVWTFSWIIGWEFMHRWLLLTSLKGFWRDRAWLLVPIIEFTYHLGKPLIEAAGVLCLSLCLCVWVRKTGRVLLPALVHLTIEIGLLFYLVS